MKPEESAEYNALLSGAKHCLLITKIRDESAQYNNLRWDVSHSAEVNENINLGYSQDQGYS